MAQSYWKLAVSAPGIAVSTFFARAQITSLLASASLAIAVQCIRALFLFTKSDIKTVLIPTTVFAIASSYPHTSAAHVLHSICWTWLHLLQFCVANQLNSISEDATNKPWRPLPSNVISWIAARHLRWTLLPLCLLLSLIHGTMDTSWVLSVATYVHNDLELGEQWLNRNLLCAMGYWAFNRGASVIAFSGRSISIDGGKGLLTAETVISMIIGTTIHAQDFRDVEGDNLKGRTTLPIIFPRGSRWSVLIAILGWSVVLARWVSMVHWALKIGYVTMGACVGCMFVLHARIGNDRKSYDAYNVWLCASQAMSLCI